MVPRRLLYLVTEDWYFTSHRLPMARAARDAGYEVHVATQVGDQRARIEAEGFIVHPLAWKRGSTDPRAAISVAGRIRALYRRVRPDLVHSVGLQPSVIGSLAAVGLPMAMLNAMAGLGFAFTSATPRARAVRAVLRPAMRGLFARRRTAVLVQNPDDHAAMVKLGISPGRLHLIPGSGVDAARLRLLPEPAGAPSAAYVGRLLEDKGLRALVEAHELLASRGVMIPLRLAGSRDPANPASFSAAEIEGWRRLPGVELLGHVPDVLDVWAAAHIAVLPSRREGLPLSLLEAAACGRPLIATDVPGCREIARAGVNAILVPVDDPPALAAALERLAGDERLRLDYGTAGRRLVESTFSSARVGAAIVRLYDELLDSP